MKIVQVMPNRKKLAVLSEDSNTGIGYDFDNPSRLEDILVNMAKEPSKILKMKASCLHKAKAFVPQSVIRILIEQII